MNTLKAQKVEIEFADGLKRSYSGDIKLSFEPAANDNKEPGRLFLIVGPSGTGKTTLVRALQKHGITEIVSYTTRAPRLGEREGKDYFFVSREYFEQMDARGEFIETVEYNGNLYGTSRKVITEAMAHGNAMIIVEPHGAAQLKNAFPSSAASLFLKPPPLAELRRRMEARGDKPEVIEKRLSTVAKEATFEASADYTLLPGTPEEILQAALSVIE